MVNQHEIPRPVPGGNLISNDGNFTVNEEGDVISSDDGVNRVHEYGMDRQPADQYMTELTRPEPVKEPEVEDAPIRFRIPAKAIDASRNGVSMTRSELERGTEKFTRRYPNSQN